MCFFFKQKTAYEMRISDWSSDVCSSDLGRGCATIAHPSLVLCGWNSPRRARRIAEDEGSGSRAGGPGCPVGAGRRQSGEWGRRSSIGGVGAGGVDQIGREAGRERVSQYVYNAVVPV